VLSITYRERIVVKWIKMREIHVRTYVKRKEIILTSIMHYYLCIVLYCIVLPICVSYCISKIIIRDWYQFSSLFLILIFIKKKNSTVYSTVVQLLYSTKKQIVWCLVVMMILNDGFSVEQNIIKNQRLQYISEQRKIKNIIIIVIIIK
jgi:hypothetical protein